MDADTDRGGAATRLRERVLAQAKALPDLYARFDLDRNPERLALAPDDASELDRIQRVESDERVRRDRVLSDPDLVELIRTATFLGDATCDAYAARLPEYGIRELTGMLRQACREGVDTLPQAPEELRTFIAQLEQRPDWIDFELVERGCRLERISAAYTQPYVIRGAFIATFLNQYAALPMALTGALSGTRAARRVNETSAFFTCTVLPGGMDRDGPGFEAAAMVRLMHSVVRFHALNDLEPDWDPEVYGVPIPQVDQMPAGLIGAFILATGALRAGRDEFTPDERAMVEMARYRCFLLGLPEELLPVDPVGVVEVFLGRAATLRARFTDETCGALIRSTLAADLIPHATGAQRLTESFERSFATMFFIKAFLLGAPELAAQLGVRLSRADRIRVSIMTPWVLGRFLAIRRLSRNRLLADAVDRHLVRRLQALLRRYGHPEYALDIRSPGSTSRPRSAQPEVRQT